MSTGAPPPRSGPLAGIRVLELGSFIAGPFAGQLLGDPLDVVGIAGVVTLDHVDLQPVREAVLMQLLIKADASPDAVAKRRNRARHRKTDADLDDLVSCVSR